METHGVPLCWTPCPCQRRTLSRYHPKALSLLRKQASNLSNCRPFPPRWNPVFPMLTTAATLLAKRRSSRWMWASSEHPETIGASSRTLASSKRIQSTRWPSLTKTSPMICSLLTETTGTQSRRIILWSMTTRGTTTPLMSLLERNSHNPCLFTEWTLVTGGVRPSNWTPSSL